MAMFLALVILVFASYSSSLIQLAAYLFGALMVLTIFALINIHEKKMDRRSDCYSLMDEYEYYMERGEYDALERGLLEEYDTLLQFDDPKRCLQVMDYYYYRLTEARRLKEMQQTYHP